MKPTLVSAALIAVPAILICASGCEQAPPPAPPVVKKEVPIYVPPPPITTVADLMDELNIDPRIIMEETTAPRSTEERRAVLSFVNAMTRGDTAAVRTMLAMEDQLILDQLIASGTWGSTVADISNVMVMTGQNTNRTNIGSSTANLAVLAIFMVDNEFQPTLWYLEGDKFASGPTPPQIDRRVSAASLGGLIDSWHSIIEQERKRGQELEIDISLPQQILEQREQQGDIPGAPTPPSLPSPGGPGSPPGNSPGPGVPL